MNVVMSLVIKMLAIISAIVTIAITPKLLWAGCTKDTDCKGTRICSNGICVEPSNQRCDTDKDCPGKLVCQNQRCVYPDISSLRPSHHTQDTGSRNLAILEYSLRKKGYGLIALDIFLPFTIGSWVVGNYIGAGIGTGMQFIGMMMIIIPYTAWYPNLDVVIAGAALQFLGWLVGVISFPIYVSSFNTNLRNSLATRGAVGSLHGSSEHSRGGFSLPKVSVPPICFHW